MKRHTATPAPKSKVARRSAVKRAVAARRPGPVDDMGPREIGSYSSLSLSGGDFGFDANPDVPTGEVLEINREIAEFSEGRAAS
jgi:hypothetical protein